jgi:hypothetical protein
MDRSKLPLKPCHVGVPSGVSKMIYQPMVHSVQTKHVSCDKINTISKRTETGFLLTHVTKGVPSSAPKTFSEPISRSVQNNEPITRSVQNSVPILHRGKHCLQIDPNELPLDPHHEGVSLGVSKMISEHMVRSAQTKHLSCVEINTVPKWTDTSVHLTRVT